MRSTVLVTGGAGFIGSHVVDRLAASGFTPRILDSRSSPWHRSGVQAVLGDVLSVEDVTAAARDCVAIVHLAAAADVADVHADPVRSTELNAIGTLNVLEAARRANVARVVYASTVWVYSDVEADEVDEDTLLPPPAHLYTAGKLSGELYCRSYAELYGVESTIVRFGIPYGPRARPAAVIPSFVGRALRGEQLTIAGSGEQERSFIYVEDLAEGVVSALAPHAGGRTYNLAGRETTTVRDLAELVRDEVAPVEIVHTEGRAGDLRGAAVCSDRAERELGWRAETPLREGVRRYASWLAETSAETPAPARAPAREGGLRPVARRIAAAGVDPVLIGFVGLIAVVSSMLPVLVATHDDGNAAGVTAIALALLLPLWSVTVGHWRGGLRRVQTAIAAGVGVLGVLLAVLFSPEELGQAGQRHWTIALLVAGVAASALWIVPARTADDRP